MRGQILKYRACKSFPVPLYPKAIIRPEDYLILESEWEESPVGDRKILETSKCFPESVGLTKYPSLSTSNLILVELSLKH